MSYDAKIKEISIRIFGSDDYESILDILSPYDGMVKLFKNEVCKLQQEAEV